jgi:hypothetical protein
MELGTIIATRELDGPAGMRLVVHMGAPRPFDSSDGWYCPYQITGAGDEKIRFAGGVDGIQSLRLAMVKIDADLSHLRGQLGGELKWMGDRDLGF